MKSIFIALLALSISSISQAEDKVFIKQIKISGLKRTKKYVIKNELGLRSNTLTDMSRIEEAISDLRNTNLFSKVIYKLQGDSQKDLLIKVYERWTTIPILSFSSGGGVGQTSVGVFDPNVFGHFVEAGVRYQRLGETNSGVVWFKNPRLFGKRQGIDIQAWVTNRLRTKYEQEPEEPVFKTGFLHKRNKASVSYFKEFTDQIKGHIIYEYNDDTFTDDFLEDEVREAAVNFGIPVPTETHFIGLGLDFGKLYFEGFKVDGFLTEFRIRQGLVTTENINNFTETDFSMLYYKTLKWDITFAQRILSGFTTTNILQYWKYLGGLDRIRGFADNRFSGRYFWLSNTEGRIPLFRNKWAVIQSTAFVDIVGASETVDEFAQITGASAGGGLRLFLPKLYRFTVRFDFAQPLVKQDDMSFSFGVQQFF